jgi:hypothetical protein
MERTQCDRSEADEALPRHDERILKNNFEQYHGASGAHPEDRFRAHPLSHAEEVDHQHEV